MYVVNSTNGLLEQSSGGGVNYGDAAELIPKLNQLNGSSHGALPADKLAAALESKEAVASAIEAKGVEVANAPFAEYAAKIREIKAAPVKVEGTPGNGFPVRFFDYDGTLLKTHYVHKGEDATPPGLPEHEYLSFQKWNNDYTNIQGPTDTGAIYTSKDGASYFFVYLYSNNKTIGCPHVVTGGTTTIEWGDGTTSTNSGTFTEIHTYEKPGYYVIRMTASAGATVRVDTNDVDFFKYNLSYTVKRIIFSDFVTYVNFQEYGIYSAIESITFSANTKFERCWGVNGSFPIFIENKKSHSVCSALGVKHVIMSGVYTDMGNMSFSSCRHISSLIIPGIVKTVIVGYDARIQVLVLQRSTPPSVSLNQCYFGKIYVPQGSLEAYQTATNWSALADIMEEYTEETILW